ncbi:diaminopimelate decarboxylase [Buchnera aphidicola str. Bp (Baizongia pistaciae)]|uniref:Diaminopimelate decarboxylase n=1 Tax=Buchnera aphidicola subsp. Baizongia pistaciae (strain Bp) TaxID=224915 RepID=DCDA_BUCBP|nr:diaminopimelate decarboxylase [Buchnera aphidicola]Q89AC6.1 RecName: Full=Diaminopimelate decarboxylase; Short=DAP decarboxylase; Short=DAPDC [Buchnera aphidicola str. Bp (Baizongia pistaciae)]AAO27100.1 diaminopimelate decarboxylase [Buchnera aphidicola str. Bp (Baizongia pistaciae)]
MSGLLKKKQRFSCNDILKIVSKYGTPLWVYDSNIIVKKIKELSQFDVIRFAQKSCSNIHILNLFYKYNVKIDAVSLGEIERALISKYRFTMDQDVVFTSDIIERETLNKVVQYKIPINIGSIDMLEQVGKISPGHNIWLRINPKFGHGHSKKTNTGGENSKHGIWDINLAFPYITKYNFKLIGLHMHIGSGVDYCHLKRVCKAMIDQVLQCKFKIHVISAGGGLTVPYHCNDEPVNVKNYFFLWNKARKIISNYLNRPIRLEIEPGRFLVAESGILVSEIRVIKKTNNRTFILVDSGFNDLIRPAMYGSYHHISVIPRDGRCVNYDDTIEAVVCGPLCESGDVFTQNEYGDIKTRILPNVQIGDFLVFHDTGAYGASMSSNYNSRPLIPEILFKDNEFHIIRRRQTMKELLELEINCI